MVSCFEAVSWFFGADIDLAWDTSQQSHERRQSGFQKSNQRTVDDTAFSCAGPSKNHYVEPSCYNSSRVIQSWKKGHFSLNDSQHVQTARPQFLSYVRVGSCPGVLRVWLHPEADRELSRFDWASYWYWLDKKEISAECKGSHWKNLVIATLI